MQEQRVRKQEFVFFHPHCLDLSLLGLLFTLFYLGALFTLT
jgi:hypothetical protein